MPVMFLVVHFPFILLYTNIVQWWVMTWWLWLDTISRCNTVKPKKCQQSKEANIQSHMHLKYYAALILLYFVDRTKKSLSLKVSNQLAKLYTCRCSWWVQKGWKGLHFVPQCTVCELCCSLILIFTYNFTAAKASKCTHIKKLHRCIYNLFLNLIKIYVTKKCLK
jgi:hypothetical protein